MATWERIFKQVKKYLCQGGLAIFDANTLALLRNLFASNRRSLGLWEWQGLVDDVIPGDILEARLSGPAIRTHLHCERHWRQPEIFHALELSGLRPAAVLGQREHNHQILLEDQPDEERHSKLIFIVRHA